MSSAQEPASDPRTDPLDDAEKGLYDPSSTLTPPPPFVYTCHARPTLVESPPFAVSPVHQGITPCTSVPELSLPLAAKAQIERIEVAEVPVPSPKPVARPKPKTSRWIIFELWFNVYRRFFTLVLTLNFIGILLAAMDRFPWAENHLGTLVLGNLLGAILMRNELFVRSLYTIAIYGLRSWAPLHLKLGVTSILQHLGGIHSGCAISGAAWLVYKIVDVLRHYVAQHPAVIASGILTNLLILISILSALPWIRNNWHNVFEKHHRFIGWLGLAMTWVFVILGNMYNTRTGQWATSTHAWLGEQELWIAVFMTIFVLIPWLTLREVPVEVEIPSPKVAILRFERGMQQGLLGRISRTSVLEYHAFGIISEGRKAKHHYMICGVQGDFTRQLVADCPKTVWTRQMKFAGVGHASAMFKRGIRICTGTGIGAALSTCIQSPDWFLIWIGSDQEKTFGPTIASLVRKHIEPERMILWDSKKRGGRPDTVQLLKDTWKTWGAEVIFITSNMQGNDEMMQGCRAAGLHAFGTLWDF